MLHVASPGRELGFHPGDHLDTRPWVSTTTLREHFQGFMGPGRAYYCILWWVIFMFFFLDVKPSMGRGAETGPGGECWITLSFKDFLSMCSELCPWPSESLPCRLNGRRWLVTGTALLLPLLFIPPHTPHRRKSRGGETKNGHRLCSRKLAEVVKGRFACPGSADTRRRA